MTLRTRMLLTVAIIITMTMFLLGIVFSWDIDSTILKTQLLRMGGIALFVLALAIFITYLLADRITEPISKISKAAHAVQSGEYKAKDLEKIIQRPDELGELGKVFDKMAREVAERDKRLQLLKIIIPMGVRLSAEKDFDRLLEMMVIEAQKVTNADGGTLYLRERDKLRFVVLRNNSLDIQMGGRTGKEIAFSPLNLYDENGSENLSNVAAYVAIKGERVHLADAYTAKGFDFSGTKRFDKSTGYRSKSFLAFPLEGDDGKVIGVLQLINALDPEKGEIIPFSSDEVIQGLSLLTSAALAGYIRAEALRQEINKLRIEIDEKKRDVQVAEITDSAYFRELHAKAREVRAQKKKEK